MLIYGIGEHAKVVYDCVDDSGTEVSAFFDDKISMPQLFGKSVMKYDGTVFKDEGLVMAIGSNESRRKVSEKVVHAFSTVVHRSSIVSSRALLSEGCMVMQGAVLQINARLGRHVIVNTSASVDHDCIIGDYSHIAPNSTLCGNVKVGEGTLIGSGSTVIPGITIGKWCIIGAGSVVIRDVPDFSMVVGNPGKVIKNLKA